MLLVSSLVTSLVLNAPVRVPTVSHVRAAPLSMGIVDDIKDAFVSTNTDKTLRNVVALQMTAWGAGSLLIPKLMTDTIFAAGLGGASIPLARAGGLGLLALGAATAAGSDADAAVSGFLFFGVWYNLLKNSGWGAYTQYVLMWNAACALSCARRQGGLWSTVTTLDTGALSAQLPRNYDLSLTNMLGAQVAGWGVLCMFYPAVMTGARFFNAAVNPTLLTGIGLANILLAGKIFGGSDSDAATKGLVLIGGYGVIGYLAKAAGLWSGSWLTATIAWNLAFAAYCLKEKL